MRTFLTFLAISLSLVLVNTTIAGSLQGQVVGVSDGDTVTVLDANRMPNNVRLAGIDAPEKAQAYGQKAKESLSELVYGKTVDVEWAKSDRYNRIIGKITLNGVDINLEQIKRGMAWHYKQYQLEQTMQDRISYAESERRARDKKTGLWQDPVPVEPWAFRRPK
jgi:endonuclease YncB( thermonuclease family)